MIKLIALTVTLAAFSLSSSFACSGGSCDKGGAKDKTKDGDKPQMMQVVNF